MAPAWDEVPSWEEVVRTHRNRVYGLAYRLTGNRHDAEDLTHDAFLRVFKALPSYRPQRPGSFEAWLYRITTNLFLDRVRRQRRLRMEPLLEELGQRLGRVPSAEQIVLDSSLTRELRRAIQTLSPEYRAAVVLSDLEGLSYEQVAETLGVPLGTVRSRIHRGRSQLREALSATDAASAPATTSRPAPSARGAGRARRTLRPAT